jgi:UDP-N-acetylmuramate--alanine ligase
MRKSGIDEKKVHFIGIGGISMSGLAMILMTWGIQVSGSDRTDSGILERLRKLGADVHIGHKAGLHEGASLVVYTSAIPDNNAELMAARASGMPVIRRAELLKRIMNQYDKSIGITGAHGKTTCTSMTATILYKCNKNPTIHIGAGLPLIGGSVRVGGSGIFVTEADEYKESFLAFPPTIAVILNIDADHLDYYRDIEHIADSFGKYVSMLPEDGFCIVNGDDDRAVSLLKHAKCASATFGLSEGCMWRAVNISTDERGGHSFDLLKGGAFACRVSLSVPGRHHVYNALAAIAAAHCCDVEPQCAAEQLAEFRGADRRFQRIGESGGAVIYHDYAHHPAEIRATLDAASLLPHNRLWLVFQPHTFTRTKALFNDFVESFDKADRIVLLDIYAAREDNPGDISSAILCDAVNRRDGLGRCGYASGFDEAAAIVKAERQPGDLIFTVGAGDVEKLSEKLL